MPTCGTACSWTKLWNNVPKRASVVLVSGLVMMYAGIKYDYLGAAALVGASARVCVRPKGLYFALRHEVSAQLVGLPGRSRAGAPLC